eukprot:TRINITY_DN33316_c0_g1_i2.p2 TRINITY_DN33316_c0_g1~~TRINITY_DN33316_c0_g1_i2.p2  ORF type:complete len:272 (+),score=109.84 TRINITY_DN33316_c0_g1_i2:77-817(+)
MAAVGELDCAALRAEQAALLARLQGLPEDGEEWFEVMERVQELGDVLRNWEEFPALLPGAPECDAQPAEGPAAPECGRGAGEAARLGAAVLHGVLSAADCAALLQAAERRGLPAADGAGAPQPLCADDAALAGHLWQRLRARLPPDALPEQGAVHPRLRVYASTPPQSAEAAAEKHLLSWDRADGAAPCAELRVALGGAPEWRLRCGLRWRAAPGSALLCAGGAFGAAVPPDGALLRADITRPPPQ